MKSELTECWNDDTIKIEPYRIPHRVFLVLKELVLDTNGNAILHMLFDKVFPSWIKVYLKQIKNKNREKREANWETFDAIFELLSVSIDGNEANFLMFKDRGLVKDIAEIVTKSSSKSIGYLPLMKLITSVCETDVKFAP